MSDERTAEQLALITRACEAVNIDPAEWLGDSKCNVFEAAVRISRVLMVREAMKPRIECTIR